MDNPSNVYRPVVIIFCFACVIYRAVSEQCPTFCVCDTWYGLQRASCIGRHLYSIHTDAPSSVQALDLSNNSISSLDNYQFASVDLIRIKYLNLSENSIGEIGLNAFHGIADLTVVDLSKNHLHYVLPHTFAENKNLRMLKLSRNNFNVHVPRLECSSLTDLSMDSCFISHIPLDTFNGLGLLRNLDLSNNMMIQLDTLAVQTMPLLRKLSLEGNPWTCNAVMRDLELYLRRKNTQFTAICDKTLSPKKFENLVLGPPKKPDVRRRPSTSDKQANKTQVASHNNLSVRIDRKDIPTRMEPTNPPVNTLDTHSAVSPYWFFAIGFLLGCAASMVVCYLWLASKFCLCQRRTYSRESANDPQRIYLLQNLWQLDERVIDDNTSQTVSCPGTPPPPYREVMLHPGFYRSRT